MLCGLLTPTFGTAKVLGEDLYKSNSNIKNSIGYMAKILFIWKFKNKKII